MARVTITTEGGSIVYKSGAISAADARSRPGAERIRAMIERSIEDAERIERGEDPRRPSEIAMEQAMADEDPAAPYNRPVEREDG